MLLQLWIADRKRNITSKIKINFCLGILNPDGIELIDASNETGEKRGASNDNLWPRDADGNLRIPYNFTDTCE